MVGRTIAVRYELTASIADGPIFDFFAAKDRLTGRVYGIRLIKEPFNSQGPFISALAKQIAPLAENSPHVERIDELIESDGTHALIGELPKGSLLQERIKRFAPFSVAVALSTVVAICEGLVHLHRSGIVHGDVGAHNVVATHEGGAKLQLAGVWRTYATSDRAGLAVLPQMAPYLAPEVGAGAAPSVQSDLYSLGVILFQLLTGRLPYQGETPIATIQKHTHSPVPSARGLNPSVPAGVDKLIQTLLAKNPAERPVTAEDCLAELRKMEDALRFGRSIPTKNDIPKGTPAPPAPEPKPVSKRFKSQDQAPKDVAPKMSAIRDAKEDRKRRTKERDVPVWFLGFALFMVVAGVGAVMAWWLYTIQKPRLVEVPSFTNQSFEEAKVTAKKLGFQVRILSKEPNDKVEIEKIVRSMPDAGEEVREGGNVGLVLSTGPRIVTMPNLKGLTMDQARIILGRLNITLSDSPVRAIDNVNPPGTIVKQLPEATKRIDRAVQVRLWIAAPPDAGTELLPGESTDGPKAFAYAPIFQVNGTDQTVRVKIIVLDEKDPRTVFDERRGPGEKIPLRFVAYGEKVTCRVYYDEEFVFEKEIEPNYQAQ